MKSKDDILKLLHMLDQNTAESLEDETLEFKQWISTPKELYKKIIEQVVCFANQNGGTIVLGVNDKTIGRQKALQGCFGYNLEEIKSRIYNSTDPKILVTTDELMVEPEKVTLILIQTPKAIGIVTTTEGEAKIRIGRECKPFTGSLRQKKMIEIGIVDFSAQEINIDCQEAIDPIEMVRLRNYLQTANPNSTLVTLNDADLLHQLELISGNKPTTSCLLLVGSEKVLRKYIPNHELIYIHMKNSIEYDFRLDLCSGILSSIEQLKQAIENFNHVTTIRDGLFHYEIKDFPEETYREAIMNAIMHRDYMEAGSIIIKQYKDNIEIVNPGGFIGGISPENILRQQSKPRNRLLAGSLRQLGLVEKAGMGIKRMFYCQLISGKELPKIEADQHQVKVILKDGLLDHNFIRWVKQSERDGTDFSLEMIMILSLMKRHKEISLQEASHFLQFDETRAKDILMNMIERNYLERAGTRNQLIYRLSAHLSQQLGDSIAYQRLKGIDEVRYPEMVLAFVKDHKKVTSSQVQELLNIDKYKASRLLKKLVDAGKLRKEGSKKGTFYLHCN